MHIEFRLGNRIVVTRGQPPVHASLGVRARVCKVCFSVIACTFSVPLSCGRVAVFCHVVVSAVCVCVCLSCDLPCICQMRGAIRFVNPIDLLSFQSCRVALACCAHRFVFFVRSSSWGGEVSHVFCCAKALAFRVLVVCVVVCE